MTNVDDAYERGRAAERDRAEAGLIESDWTVGGDPPEVKLARVRELHQPDCDHQPDPPHERLTGYWCAHCQADSDDAWWPCATIRAINGGGES